MGRPAAAGAGSGVAGTLRLTAWLPNEAASDMQGQRAPSQAQHVELLAARLLLNMQHCGQAPAPSQMSGNCTARR